MKVVVHTKKYAGGYSGGGFLRTNEVEGFYPADFNDATVFDSPEDAVAFIQRRNALHAHWGIPEYSLIPVEVSACRRLI